jgi:hypothetical protein
VTEVARAVEEKPNGPVDRLKAEAGGLVNALADRALSSVRGKVEDTTSRLTGFAEGEAGPGLMAAVTGARNLAEGKSPARSMMSAGFSGLKEKISGMFGRGKGKGRGGKKLKLTNIIESIDVGVPVRLAYDQWNQFSEFPTFMKKVENAERVEDTKINWKAQVFWSHRTWESTVIDQHPDERIIWRSKGQKGHVDGAVTFHELAPNLTRIVLVLEYHPQGLFERTGNIWRAQGRRVRLELKHFARHVMTNSVLKPDEIEGWRGVIEDSEVVLDHEQALQQESREQGEGSGEGEGPRSGEAPQTDEGAAQRAASEGGSADEPDEGTADARRSRRRPAGKAADDEDASDEDASDEGEAPQGPADESGGGEGRANRGNRSGRTVAAHARGQQGPSGDQPQRRAHGTAREGSRQ